MNEADQKFLDELKARVGWMTLSVGDGQTITVSLAEYERLQELALKHRVTVRFLLSPSRQ